MITAFFALYRLIGLMLWFGVMFAICTVIIAVVLTLVIGAVVMGLTMPSRTVRGQLAALVLNARQLVIEVDALRPS
jgi:hypothetical protein